MQNEAKKIIRDLETGNFFIECPSCNESFPSKKAHLFPYSNLTADAKEIFDRKKQELKEYEAELREERKNISTRSEKTTKAVNIGFISERLAPVLPGFNFEHTDCRSIFDPIDYIIFEGLSKKGVVTKIFFVDIKTGKARLKDVQKQVKEAVEKKRVDFKVYKGDNEWA